MPATQAVPLAPTWHGYINTTRDATILIEAVLRGDLTHVPRRPHDRERSHLIQSGNIFIYSEASSGIKRWTDGIHWSPSRILGNFLVYRELEAPFAPGQKKRALKKNRKPSNSYNGGSTHIPPEDRALIGSLVDSYDFKNNGLIKKTISLEYHGMSHHIVSYYTISDIKSQQLHSPSESEMFKTHVVRPGISVPSQSRNPQAEDNLYGAPGSTTASAHAQVHFGAAPLGNHFPMGLPSVDHYDQQPFQQHQNGQYTEYTTGSVSRQLSQGNIRQQFQATTPYQQQQSRAAHSSQGFSSPMPFLTQHDAGFGVGAPPVSQMPQVSPGASMAQINYGSSNQSQPLAAMEPRNLARAESGQNHVVHSSSWADPFPHYGNNHHSVQLFNFGEEQTNWS